MVKLPLPEMAPEYVVFALLAPTVRLTAVESSRLVKLNVPVPSKPCAVMAVMPEATFTALLLVKIPLPNAVVLPKVKVPAVTVVPPV